MVAWFLMAIAGLWMADGVALLVAPLWVVERMRHVVLTSTAMSTWSGVTLVAGLILIFASPDLDYQALWVVMGVAMMAKGGVLLLASDDTCQALLRWWMSREAVDYRFTGLVLCVLSLLLLHALGGFGPS